MTVSVVTDGTPWARSHARAGDFVFIGGLTPHDEERGALVTGVSEVDAEARSLLRGPFLTDAPEQRPLAQSWRIYSNLQRVLSEYGCQFGDVLRQRVYVRDLRDVPMIERVMARFFGSELPATTIVQVPTDQMDPRISVFIDAVALAKDSSNTVDRITLPGFEDVFRSYPQATRAGQFVFFSGAVGWNPETGTVARSLAEVGDDGTPFGRYESPYEQAIAAQTLLIYRSFGAIMESLGGSLADLIKVNGWLSYPMRDCEPMVVVRESLYSKATEMPASCSIGISAIRPAGALESYDAVGLVPDGPHRKEVSSSPSDLSPLTVLMLKAGPLVYTCGEVPVDVNGGRPVVAFDDLDDSGRTLGYGRAHEEAGIQARAWYVYRELGKYLAGHGASLGDVVHQTVFMCNPNQYPALERVACHMFGTSQMAPTTVVPITDTSPFRQAELEVEVVASAG